VTREDPEVPDRVPARGRYRRFADFRKLGYRNRRPDCTRYRWYSQRHAVLDVLSHARPRLLSRAEYERLVDAGMYRGERVELIRGLVVEMPPIGVPHSDPIDFLTRHFILSLGDRAVVRVQLPFAASDDSEPEPDLALVPTRRYNDYHPNRAFLIVEVADSSLAHDQETKGPLYASCGAEEYWIVDVNARQIEAYDRPSGERYGRVRHIGAGEEIAPAAFPDIVVRIAEPGRCSGTSSGRLSRRQHLLPGPDGMVRVTLKRPFSDGTFAIDLDPLSLLCRLAATVPPPRFHTVRYGGVLASASKWRPLIVPKPAPVADAAPRATALCEPPPPCDTTGSRYRPWCELLRRTFGIDVETCPRCGARMRLLALITEPAEVARSLRHQDDPTEPPPRAPARDPPFWQSRVLRRRHLEPSDQQEIFEEH
jgi:Uma2 family endonuclease